MPTDRRVADMAPFEYIELRWPDDPFPYFRFINIWAAFVLNDRVTVFPKLEYPKPAPFNYICLGQDFDGSEVLMVTSPESFGATAYITAPNKQPLVN